MSRLIFKVSFLIMFIVLLIFSTIQYRQNLILKEYIGKSYSDTINYLDNEMYNLQIYISEFENYQERSEDIIASLDFFKSQLLEIEMEFHNMPNKLPMRKNYYGYLYGALKGDICHIINITNDINTWIDKDYIQGRILDTCEKIRWSYSVIRENSENYHGNYGYFQELYNIDSKTHNIIDVELERYLKDVYHINVN